MSDYRRGEVYLARMPGFDEAKPYLVVSNNRRNAGLESVLVVRITTTLKRQLPSIVTVPDGECVVGRILCDDVQPMYPEDVQRRSGGLSRRAMRSVEDGLLAAFDIQR